MCARLQGLRGAEGPETTLDVLEQEIGADLSYFRERTCADPAWFERGDALGGSTRMPTPVIRRIVT